MVSLRTQGMVNNLDQILNAAAQYTRNGQLQQARQLLWQVISLAPYEERAWLLLASAAQTIEERRAALWRVLLLNPGHAKVKQAYLQTMDMPSIQQAAQAGVFISYAHCDEVFAVELADDLRFFGVQVWVDIMDMPDGSDWFEAVEKAMAGCGVMLLVGSPAALRADNVRSEIKRFADAGKIILPVLYQPADLSTLSLWYPVIHFEEDYSSGLQDIIRLLTMPEPVAIGKNKPRP